ncbi:ADP-ribosylation factor-like protein 3 [Nosema granulosis]|uniref:ADP-ribosylation factor-like protein 3 n=1 Tax=Nosema granulosis TaxID=83296 RepID=A0A9P6H1K3_9MICR|nr:ADP-ribosylation factor-like protein 3 [Nosema granulosis]
MTFSRIIKEIKLKSKEIKIVVVGLDNAGKTTIIHKIFNKPIEHISPTFGYQTSLCIYKDTTVQILDIGGQSLFREYWDSYFEKADGIIYVYDLSSKEMDIQYLSDIINTTDIPILIFGNKVDLVEVEDVNCEESRIKHLRCSGTKGINLEKGMDWLVRECRRRLASK